jgi:hypothetical protein
MQLKQELRLQFCRNHNLPKPFLLIYRWAGSRPLPLRGWWSLQFGARLAAGNDVKRQGARVSRHSSKACILASNGFALRPRIAEIALHDILSSWVGDNCRRGINQLVGLSRLWHHVRLPSPFSLTLTTTLEPIWAPSTGVVKPCRRLALN